MLSAGIVAALINKNMKFHTVLLLRRPYTNDPC